MARIAIIGLGALGSRHLQALAKLKGPLQIDAVDPSTEARDKAVAMYKEAGGEGGTLSQWTEVSRLVQIPDLAIVSTNSRERMPVLKILAERGCHNILLEKFLFTRQEEYLQAAGIIETTGAKVWVNCARRTAPRYHRLRELIAGRPIAYRVEGYSWGLACNVIHHLDEWASLAHVREVSLSCDLRSGAIPARRQGYLEVLGRLSASDDRSSFTAESWPGRGEGPAGERTTIIRCEDMTLTVGQTSQELTIGLRDRVLAREPYPVAMQSEATSWHAATILSGGEPPLPRYAESAKLHLALLDILLPHFQSIDPSLCECPIT